MSVLDNTSSPNEISNGPKASPMRTNHSSYHRTVTLTLSLVPVFPGGQGAGVIVVLTSLLIYHPVYIEVVLHRVFIATVSERDLILRIAYIRKRAIDEHA